MTSKKVVGILGGGQLGRMLVEPANRHNIKCNILDAEKAPAKQISNGSHITGSFADKQKVKELAETADVITVEIEHIDTYALEEVADRVAIEPHWRTIRIIQNKFHQKQHLEKHGVAVAEYEEVKDRTPEAVAAIGEKLRYPFMLKSQTQAYDGKGNAPVKSKEGIESALKSLGSNPLYAEKWADFKMELAVMVVKTKDDVLSFPTVETVHEDSICKLVYAPARNVSSQINTAAQSLARKAIACFEGKGVFGVEMFLLRDDTLVINEIAPRPHNSGHYTIEACPISQYEAHLRAILDLPITQHSLRLKEPAIMLNILGGAKPDSHITVATAALNVPDVSIHLYEKGDARPGRKMGHLTLTAPSMAECEKGIAPLVALTNRLRDERTDIPPPDRAVASIPSTPSTSARQPLVGVIMGSDSDLPVLLPGLRLLEDTFHIPVLVDITSAHRTPDYMASFASQAAGRGLKCIIAAAGGAAHLPGMTSSHTTLPVIAVPVKASVLDGVDAVYSSLQMPPGVPVAVMGVDRAQNAALYAVRILAAFDDQLKEKYEAYVKGMEEENLAKSKRLQSVGWREYKRA